MGGEAPPNGPASGPQAKATTGPNPRVAQATRLSVRISKMCDEMTAALESISESMRDARQGLEQTRQGLELLGSSLPQSPDQAPL